VVFAGGGGGVVRVEEELGGGGKVRERGEEWRKGRGEGTAGGGSEGVGIDEGGNQNGGW